MTGVQTCALPISIYQPSSPVAYKPSSPTYPSSPVAYRPSSPTYQPSSPVPLPAPSDTTHMSHNPTAAAQLCARHGRYWNG